MTAYFKGGACLLLPFFLLSVLVACDPKEEEKQKEPTVLQMEGISDIPALNRTLILTVECDFQWTASVEGADWLTVDSVSETTSGGRILLHTAFNHSDAARTGTVVVKSGSKSVSKTITQAGIADVFNPQEIHLTGLTESTMVFNTPAAWTASVAEGAEWINLKTTGGNAGKATVVVVAKDPNENVGDRSGSLTITIDGDNFSIPVIQSQKDIILTDNVGVIQFGYKGGHFTVLTQSNVSYKIECGAAWIQHLETKALNEAQESFSVEANSHTSNAREAIISFIPIDGAENARVDLRVSQEGVDEFVFNIRMPGIFFLDNTNYVYGANGWNLSSTVLQADGRQEFRMLNRSKLSALIITGYDPAAEEGSTAHLSVIGLEKTDKFLMREFDATLIDYNEELMWYRTADGTGFVIQK